MKNNFYRRDPQKALSGMVGLSLEERGVYNTVIDLLYTTWRPLEDNRHFIANWCGCAVQKLNPILKRLIAQGRLITFEEDGRTYLSDEAFEAERNRFKGASNTRSGRAEVREKSGEVDEKSAGVGENMPVLDTKHEENQSLPAKEKKRKEKKPPNPQGDQIDLRPFSEALQITAAAGCLFSELIDKIHQAQPVVDGRRRSARPDIERALRSAVQRGGAPSDIWAAVQAYYRLPASTKDGGQYAQGAVVVLNRDRWREYLPTQPNGPREPDASVAFDGPPALLASVAEHTSEEFARLWVAPCKWRESDRTLIAPNPFTAKRLRAELSVWMDKTGVNIEVSQERKAA